MDDYITKRAQGISNMKDLCDYFNEKITAEIADFRESNQGPEKVSDRTSTKISDSLVDILDRLKS